MSAGMTVEAAPRLENAQRRSIWRRIAPAFWLFWLAPLVGEYLLGNVTIEHIWGLVVLAPMYGGGAVLVRETARRAGRGWQTMILLGLAYGVFQAGLLDQSMFNPSYMGQDFQSAAPIPAFGISAHHALTFVVGHAVWSIGVPIAFVEALVPARRTTPWLGNLGLAIYAALFALGSYIIFDDHRTTEQFLVSMPQAVGTLVVVAALMVLAFAVGRRPRPATERVAPRPGIVGVVAFLVPTVFFLLVTPDWLGVALHIVVCVAMWALVMRWSRRREWDARHRLALAGGALLTYAWLGFLVQPLLGTANTISFIGNIIMAIAALLLLTFTAYTIRRSSATSKGASA